MALYLNNLVSCDSAPSVMNENMALLSARRNGVNCRLCLNEIHDSSVTLLDGIIKDMLEIILPELNLSICKVPSICKGCLETLKQSYNFKSSCLENEDRVQDFVNPKKPTLIDLKEVLRKTGDLKQISGNLIVCRTCLNLGEESLYTKLCSYEGDPLQNMVEKCLPEMGLELTKDPTVCPMCLEQLEEQFHFIMQCLDTEAKINFYSESKQVFKDVDLQDVNLFSMCMEAADDLEKQYEATESLENGDRERTQIVKIDDTFTKNNCNSLNDPVHNTKKENGDFVDLTEDLFTAKVNKIESYEATPPKKSQSHLDTHLLAKAQKITPTEEITFQIGKDTNGEDIITSQTTRICQSDSESDSDSLMKESDLLEVKKVISEHARGRKPKKNIRRLKVQANRECKKAEEENSEEEFNKKPTRMRKCKICDFKTKYGSRMKAHMTMNHSGKVKMAEEQRKFEDGHFRCRKCPFKTLNGSEYNSHKIQHRKEKEQKCPHCSIVFVRPDFLKKHVESHVILEIDNTNSSTNSPKKPKLTQVSTVNKIRPISQQTSFNMVRPKNMRNLFSFHGQVLKMYKCRLCPYQTRLKSNYEKHGMTHKKTSEIKTHRCNLCQFETIQKENFSAHMQTHENDGENKVMKCFLCSFQPSNETALKQHVSQVHKSGPA